MGTAYFILMREVTLAAPASFLSHYSIEIKWRCGGQKNAFPMLPIRQGAIITGAADDVPLLRVTLPPSMRAVVVHDGRPAVAFDLTLIRHRDARREAEKRRDTIASRLPIHLDTVGARLGVPQESLLKFGRHGSLLVEYGALLPQSNAEGTPSSDATATHEGAHSLLKPFTIPDGGDVFSSADSALMLGISCTPELTGGLASLQTIVNEGLFKSSVFEEDPCAVAASLFFSKKHKTVWEAFHFLRGDEFSEASQWRYTHDSSCAYSFNTPRLRYGKSGKRLAASEHCYVCRGPDDEFVVRTIVSSQEVPVVGSAVKLDLVFHVAGDGAGGSVVATFVHITASDMARRLGGNLIAKYSEKISVSVNEATNGLLNSRRLQGRSRGRRSYQEMKFRNSMVLNPLNTSPGSAPLDPSLWRRLVSTDTLPNRDLVYQHLSRLVTIKVSRVSESQVTGLENIIVYHRESVPVVSAACNLILVLARASSFSAVYRFSPTLCASLEQVFSLHKPGEFGMYADLLAHLMRHHRQAIREQEESISKGTNVWGMLENMVGDAGLVEQCLRSLSSRWRDLTYANILVLTKSLALHLNSEVIVRLAFGLIGQAHGCIPLLPATTVDTLLLGANTHSLEAEYTLVMAHLQRRRASFSHFETHFGYLGEKYVLKSDGWLTGPYLSKVRIYLTPGFFVVGAFVLPLESILRVVQYRSVTLRRGLRFIMTGSHDDYHVLASKWRELLVALDKRRVRIEPPLVDY